MKLTRKQQNDLDSIIYFVPMQCLGWIDKITDADIEAYFAVSDRGDRTLADKLGKTPGLEILRWGKTYRELFITDMVRDLDTVVFIWDIARDDPDIPESVLRSLGGNRLNQFKFWKAKFADDPDYEPMDVLRDEIESLVGWDNPCASYQVKQILANRIKEEK